MTVVTDFSASPQAGAPGLTVNFTDLSTGGANRWLWDFGDGNFSSDQNPTNVYTGNFGDKFDVKLTSWIDAGSSSFTLTATSSFRYYQDRGFVDDPPSQVHAALVFKLTSPGWINPSTKATGPYYTLQHRVSPNGYKYEIAKVQFSTTAAAAPNITTLEIMFTAGKETLEGSVLTDFGTFIAGDAGTWKTMTEMVASSSITDSFFEPTGDVNPAQLTTPSAGKKNGFTAALRRTTFNVGDPDDKDIETKLEYITLGIPPTAAFSGSPLSGSGSVSVQFENLSTEAVGLTTTWSWKKRLAGSGDPFVEFSTEKNPSEIFSK